MEVPSTVVAAGKLSSLNEESDAAGIHTAGRSSFMQRRKMQMLTVARQQNQADWWS